MNSYVLLLRALNVGGTNLLPMSELKAICIKAGFTDVKTYIASGNVVMRSRLSEAKVKVSLQQHLKADTGRDIDVLVRSLDEMRAVLANNPFAQAPPNRCMAIFMDRPCSADALLNPKGLRDEQIASGTREIYVYYPSGMGDSRLKIAEAAAGTARNMNTVAKLIDMAAALAG